MLHPIIREVTLSDLDSCYKIESTAYSGDEAATREKIKTRIEIYPQGFLVLEYSGSVVGLINSGATDHVHLSDEDFKELIGHDPDGKKMVIMSVAVLPGYQHMGFGGQLLSAFIQSARAMGKTGIFIICQTALVEWYKKYGFIYLGPSDSRHGGLSWHEMYCSLVI